MTDLGGKTALVTGAGRGLGFAHAAALARAGTAVLVNDARPGRRSGSVPPSPR